MIARATRVGRRSAEQRANAERILAILREEREQKKLAG
jgi:hypothetical protein